MIIAQLRHRPGRAIAILLGILVATTGFTVLTANTRTSRLEVARQADAHARGAYEILVRPTGSRSELEQRRDLLRPNFLASQYGGITRAQWQQIAALPGVEVAAPSGMFGYAPYYGVYHFDLTAAVDRTLSRQIIRQRQLWHADRQLTSAQDVPSLVYVTKRPVIWLADEEFDATIRRYSDRRSRTNLCGAHKPWPVLEIDANGRESPICLTSPRRDGSLVPALVAHLDSSGRFHFEEYGGIRASERLDPRVRVTMSFSVGAVDPEAEASLVGLDKAVVDGRYLDADSGTPRQPDASAALIPAVATTDPGVDETVSVRAERLTLPVFGQADTEPPAPQATADAAPVAGRYDSEGVTAYEIQQAVRRDGIRYSAGNLQGKVARPGPVEYQVDQDGRLRPKTSESASEAWQGDGEPPLLWTDTSVRPEVPGSTADVPAQTSSFGAIDPVGFFDPGRLTRFDPLAQAPLELYDTDRVTAADRARLNGQRLAPNSNPGGYVSAPPTFLISLDTLAMLTGSPASINAIRVRVADIASFDAVSRERVRVVADEISRRTGLDVEVTLGSSPSAQDVVLPAGRYGRPELKLAEEWTRKGVAAAVVRAADRKSVVLFVLVLVVCVLFVANAVSAAVRHRRPELAVLSCVGWPRWRLCAVLTGEVAGLGLIAGLAGGALAVPVSHAAGTPLGWAHAFWAVPVGVAVAVVAAIAPAWRASGARPVAAVRDLPGDAGSGRFPVPHGVLGIAVANLSRVPGRTALGAGALAIGAAGVTALAAVTRSFHGQVTGSLLGSAVSAQVRGVDTIAVAATVLLGLVAVADVLYLNVRERASEYAVLRASGWTLWALARLVTYEGLAVGLLGGITGAAAGLAAVAGFAGRMPDGGWWIAAAVAGGAVLAAGLGTLAPALMLYRLPLAASLAEE
jgi:putative ABC transport system permease protein